MTEAELNPQPKVYPVCSYPDCRVPYVLRRAMRLDTTTGLRSEWVWQRDCKHKKAPPELGGDER
jgi:hypothetical protein